MDFAAELAKLPQAVQDHFTAAGLTDAETVAACAAPMFLKDQAGHVVEKPVDIVFVESVAAAVESVKVGTGHYAKTLTFFRKCFHETANAEKAPEPDAVPIEAKDASAE